MCIELKIKSKHLALEPKVIRHEEQKIKGQIKYSKGSDKSLINKLDSLVTHRRWNVRNESRATELARAYLAGKQYSSIEQHRKPENEHTFLYMIIPRVVSMVSKYGKREQRKITRETIQEWSKL